MKTKYLGSRKLLSSAIALVIALSGVSAISIPANASDTKSITISGFKSNSTALTKSMRAKINKFIKENSGYSYVTCVGFADRPGSASANSGLGKSRAQVGCKQALKQNSGLEIAATRGRWDDTNSGSNIRRVRIILSNSSTAQLTTYFEYMGGEKGVESVKTTVGGSIVLPTPTRAGYEFLGWFSQQYNGKKIGNGGETYTPTKTRILWAQWYVPGNSSTSSVSCSSDPFLLSLGSAGSLTYEQLEDGTYEGGLVYLGPIVPAVDNEPFIDGDMYEFLGAAFEGYSEETIDSCFSLAIKYSGVTLYSEANGETMEGTPGFFSEGGPHLGASVGDIYVGADNAYLGVFIRFDLADDPSNLGNLTLTLTWGETDYVFTGGTRTLPIPD